MKPFPTLLYVFVLFLLAILALPIIILIGIIVVLTCGFPILYFQKRIGKDNASFTIIKFRTMSIDADRSKMSVRKYNEAGGPVFKIYHDPRFTAIGKFLSHTGLDELPQLFNILKGDMAIIGPRPLPVDEVRKLKPWQNKRHTVKPGIISPWIFEGYHTKSFDDWMKSDIEYAKNKSILYDIRLLVQAMGLFTSLIIRECKQLNTKKDSTNPTRVGKKSR